MVDVEDGGLEILHLQTLGMKEEYEGLGGGRASVVVVYSFPHRVLWLLVDT